MNPTLTRKLSLHIQKTNLGSQKINGSAFKTFGIVIVDFQVEDKIGRPRLFQKIFLAADTKFEVVLEIFFLKISNVDIAFGEKTLTWKSNTPNKALLNTEQVQLVDLKEFVIVTLDKDSKTFVMHMAI